MNINNINVNKYPLSQILDPESKVIYEIPKYQREYIWGAKQWEALFDDLMENEYGYFLGSIICINTSTDAINSPKFEVVDGQQRLTTISLLLTALYTTLNKKYSELNEDQQSDILQLKRKIILKKTESVIRIIPQVQNNNLDDYRGLLAERKIIPHFKMPKFAGNRRIVRAFMYFEKRIYSAISDSDNSTDDLFEILDKLNQAIIVMIEVSNHADAYTLFESLNNRGTPLTSVDLIKNLLLARLDANKSGDLDQYFSQWTDVLSNLGDEYSVQERFFRQNYNAFKKSLNIPFSSETHQYPLGSIATRSTMLQIYEQLVTHDPKKFLDDIGSNSSIYASIILNNTDDLSSKLKESYLDLQRVQGAPAYLLLLYIVKNQKHLHITEADLIKIIKLLVNFFVRRNLTDTPPTRDLTRIFMAYIEKIEQNNYSNNEVFVNLREHLITYSASDSLFEERLRGPVYEDNKSATRFILCMIARQGMTLETHKDLWYVSNNNQYVWTIEHIFPQGHNIPQSWQDMIAGGDTVMAKEYQTLYVHTLGNLTITGYNSTLGNKSFSEKKDRKDSNGAYIGYKNNLNLNSDVCDKDEWTVGNIKKRTEKLVKIAMDMFSM